MDSPISSCTTFVILTKTMITIEYKQKKLGKLFTSKFIALSVQNLNACMSDGKESACNVGDLSSFPRLGKSPGKGIGNPLQYSCLENSMDRGAWWATVHRVTKSQTQLKN